MVNPVYDALLVVSFGGPEGRDDVIPFLENVLRGRNVPRERLLAVAEHYYQFEGISPINAQVRELIAALGPELSKKNIELPIFFGNRNWHPLLTDTMQELADQGHQRVLALVLSAWSSYSSCRQYRENILAAQQAVGDAAPQIDKIRVFFNHPGFIAANAARLTETLATFDASVRNEVHVAFTAHSIPASMAASCRYEQQLAEAARLIAEEVGVESNRCQVVYQSRSGRPQDPWLEPDICDHLRQLHQQGGRQVAVAPIGFLSDHIEVMFDLDTEARQVSEELGLQMARVATVGTHPLFVSALADMIAERYFDSPERCVAGVLEPLPDVCPVDCCPAPVRPGRPGTEGRSTSG